MSRSDVRRGGIVVLYLAAAGALALAPLLMPAGYSWLANTTSESAAQGLDGAWLARTGFLLFGFAVLLTVLVNRWWSAGAKVAHVAFGVCLIAAAAFSTRPADSSAPFVATEDTLHSVAATAVGFAFAAGVVLVAVRRGRGAGRYIALDVIAMIASVAIPLAMLAWDDWAGFAQRLIFAIAFIWYIVAVLMGRAGAATAAPSAATSSLPMGRSRPQASPVVGARPRARARG